MNISTLAMEIRSVDTERREVLGVCVPYGQTSRAVPSPRGERIMPGAFAKSIRQRAERILMYREHGHTRGQDPIGRALRFEDGATDLRAVFTIRDTDEGSRALADMREGYLPSLSVGFVPLNVRKGNDGADEVLEARLMEVSACAIAAYEGADVLAVRHVVSPDEVLAAFGKMPEVNLSPLPPLWA